MATKVLKKRDEGMEMILGLFLIVLGILFLIGLRLEMLLGITFIVWGVFRLLQK